MKRIKTAQGHIVLVDDDVYEKYGHWKWQGVSNGSGGKPYIRVNRGPRTKRKAVHLARLVIGAPPGLYVDHINGDTLDNRRKNLRLCTTRENSWNATKQRASDKKPIRSKYKGVARSVYKPKTNASARWSAAITLKGKHIFLGMTRTEKEAARRYDLAAQVLFGKFARLNFEPLPKKDLPKDADALMKVITVWNTKQRKARARQRREDKASEHAGKTYGALTVVRASSRPYFWVVNCSCGRQIRRLGSRVVAGKITSCGHDRLYLGGGRRAEMFEINGIAQTAKEWADIIGISASAFLGRTKKWPQRRWLSMPGE